MSSLNQKLTVRVLGMTEDEMMGVELMHLYQAFYALPTTYPLAMCDLATGKGFERLTQPEQEVAKRIVRVVQKRCPMPKVERWKKFEAPAANESVNLRITHH